MGVITPRIHLNGDKREVLLENLGIALAAVESAETALAECTPQGRNYYKEELKKAIDQHQVLRAHLKDVGRYLEAQIDALLKGN
jgi:hypothetical protein